MITHSSSLSPQPPSAARLRLSRWSLVSPYRALQAAQWFLTNPAVLVGVFLVLTYEMSFVTWIALLAMLPFAILPQIAFSQLRSQGQDNRELQALDLHPLESVAPAVARHIRQLEADWGQPPAQLHWAPDAESLRVFGHKAPGNVIVPSTLLPESSADEEYSDKMERLDTFLAHEFAHLAQKHQVAVRKRDIIPTLILLGVTVVAILLTAIVGPPRRERMWIGAAIVLGWYAVFLWRGLSTYALNIRAHMAEYAADDLAATWLKTPQPLIKGLISRPIEHLRRRIRSSASGARLQFSHIPTSVAHHFDRLVNRILDTQSPLHRFLRPSYDAHPRQKDRVDSLHKGLVWPPTDLLACGLGLLVAPLAATLRLAAWNLSHRHTPSYPSNLPQTLVLLIGYFVLAADWPVWVVTQSASGWELVRAILRKLYPYVVGFVVASLLLAPITAYVAYFIHDEVSYGYHPSRRPPFPWHVCLPNLTWVAFPLVWAGLLYLNGLVVRQVPSASGAPADEMHPRHGGGEVWTKALLAMVVLPVLVVELVGNSAGFPPGVTLALDLALVIALSIFGPRIPLQSLLVPEGEDRSYGKEPNVG